MNNTEDSKKEDIAALTSRRVVARSAVWRFFETAGSEVLAFAFMIVLARLLGPEDYGIIAIAGFFVISSNAILSRAVPEAIIQSGEISDAQLDSGFWANMLIGFGFSLIILATSIPIAIILDEPKLTGVFIGLSPLPILFAAVGIYQAIFRRGMLYKNLAIRTFICVFIGGTTGIVLAWFGAGVFSLVGQQIAYILANLLALIIGCRWRPKLRIDYTCLHEFRHISKHISIVSILQIFSYHGLGFLISFFLPTAQVGFFSCTTHRFFHINDYTLVCEQCFLSSAFKNVG